MWKRSEARWSREEEKRRASPKGEWCLRVEGKVTFVIGCRMKTAEWDLKRPVSSIPPHTHSRLHTCNTHKVLIKMNEIFSSTRTCHYIMRQLHYCSDPTVLTAWSVVCVCVCVCVGVCLYICAWKREPYWLKGIVAPKCQACDGFNWLNEFLRWWMLIIVLLHLLVSHPSARACTNESYHAPEIGSRLPVYGMAGACVQTQTSV